MNSLDGFLNKLNKLTSARTIDRNVFYRHIRKLGKLEQKEVDGLNLRLDFIEQDKRWQSLEHIAYYLATLKHETGVRVNGEMQTYNAIVELRSDASAERKYGYKSRKGRELGNNKPGDGAAFKGAGDIQTTGKANAIKVGKALGLNLTNPRSNFRRLMQIPEYAYNGAVIGMYEGFYTGKNLTDYDSVNGFKAYRARRIINGLDKALKIKGYYKVFLKALKESTKELN